MLPLLDLVSVALVTLAAEAIGARLLGRRDELWIALGLGFGVLSTAVFLLGCLGLISLASCLSLLVAANALRFVGPRPTRDDDGPLGARLASQLRRSWIWLFVLAPALALALFPPTGYDATNYHLAYATSFQSEGRLTFLKTLRFPVFPQAVEAIFLLTLQLGSDASAKLLHLVFGIGSVSCVFALGVALSRSTEEPVSSAQFATALFAGSPLTLWVATLAYVDLAMTFFVLAGALALVRWHERQQLRWLAYAGALVGFAAGTKYLGLFFVAVFGLLALLWPQDTARLRRTVLLGAFAALAGAPWYGRLVFLTGNPIFPFYPRLFGDSEWAPLSGPEESGALLDAPLASLGFLLSVPWTAVFERELFDFQAPLSPFFLVLIPLALPWLLRTAIGRIVTATSLVYGLLWLTLVRDLRFLLPVLALLSLGCGVALARLLGRLPSARRKTVSAVLTVTLLAPSCLYATYRLTQWGPPPYDESSRETFLHEHVPGYSTIQLLNEARGGDYTLYAPSAPYLRHYARGRLLGDLEGPHAFRQAYRRAIDIPTLNMWLDSISADHLLIQSHLWSQRARDRFARHYETVSRDAGFVLYRLP